MMHILSFFKHQNISNLIQSHDCFGKFIFHIPREPFHSNERISMNFLFRGKTLCSDETKCSRDLSFRDFLIDTKLITHKI